MGFSVDAVELRAFARAASRADSGAARGLRAGVRAAGDLVAAGARRNAGWSSRIPGSVRVHARMSVAVVEAGGPSAPHAAPLENEGREGFFRHPVNAWARHDRGAWKWADQRARPFLHPALEENAQAAADLIVSAVDRGLLEVIS